MAALKPKKRWASDNKPKYTKGDYKCPYPSYLCDLSQIDGVCCWDCGEYERCSESCLNSPAKCGLKREEADFDGKSL